jgi:membrane associated rhomboid family serine protease
MIPLGDVIPVRTRPVVTFVAMALALAAGGPVLRIAANLLSLGIFGRTVEDRMGHIRFGAFLALCAAVACGAQTIADRQTLLAAPAINGMVAGLIGAYFVLYPYSKALVLVPFGLSPRIVELPAFVFVAVWYTLHVFTSLGSIAELRSSPVPGVVPSWAHVAGAACGAAGVRLFRRVERLRVDWWNEHQQR